MVITDLGGLHHRQEGRGRHDPVELPGTTLDEIKERPRPAKGWIGLN